MRHLLNIIPYIIGLIGCYIMDSNTKEIFIVMIIVLASNLLGYLEAIIKERG